MQGGAAADRPDLDPAWRSAARRWPPWSYDSREAATCRWPRTGTAGRPAEGRPGGGGFCVEEGERVVCQLVLAPAPAAGRTACGPGWRCLQRRGVCTGREPAPTQEILPFLALFGHRGRRRCRATSGTRPATSCRWSAWAQPGSSACRWRRRWPRASWPAGTLARELVEEKLAHPAFAVQLRIAGLRAAGLAPAIGCASWREWPRPTRPSTTPPATACGRIRGEGTRRQPVLEGGLLRHPDILNAAELAGLWHLPCDAAWAVAPASGRPRAGFCPQPAIRPGLPGRRLRPPGAQRPGADAPLAALPQPADRRQDASRQVDPAPPPWPPI